MRNALFGPTWPERVLRGGFTLCLALGGVLVLTLVTELSVPSWSRMALALQVTALLFGASLMLLHRRRSQRWLLYPTLLAATVYVWDPTLPPPNLPDGLARGLVPGLVLLGIVTDALLALRRYVAEVSLARASFMGKARLQRGVPVRNGLVPVDAIAELFQISPEELVARLHRHGRHTVDTSDRGPSLWLVDLMLLLKHWHEDETPMGTQRHQR